MVVWKPSEEEIRKYPEWEYTSEEIKAVVAKMSKKQQTQFKELENYFLLKYRQIGNMHPLYQEVRQIVKEMCPSMPGNMQEAVVEVRAQLQAEAKLKDICRQLNIPVPLTAVPSSVVFPTDSSPRSEIQVLKETTLTQGDPKTAQAEIKSAEATASKGEPRRITPMQVKSEGDVKPQPMLTTQYLPDTMLKAMEGEGDKSLQILRVFCGRDPLYDLTKDDEELKEAFGFIQEDLLPTEHDEADADDLSVATVDTYDEIDSKEARELLVKLADVKTKEAQILSDLAVVVNAEDLPPRQVGEIIKSVLETRVGLPRIEIYNGRVQLPGHSNDPSSRSLHEADL